MIVGRRSFLMGAASLLGAGLLSVPTKVLAQVPKIVTPTILDKRVGKRRIIDIMMSAAVNAEDEYPSNHEEMVLWTFGSVGRDPWMSIALNWRATYRWVPSPDNYVVIDPEVGFVTGNAPAVGRTFLTMMTDDGVGNKQSETFEWKNGVLVKQGFVSIND